MRFIALLIAALLVLLGLTGVFWPEGLMGLAKYSFTTTGIYVVGSVRLLIGALLFFAARAARTPKTLQVIGILIFLAGLATLFMGTARAQELSDWWLGQGPDSVRIVACLPLAVGLFVAGATLFNDRKG